MQKINNIITISDQAAVEIFKIIEKYSLDESDDVFIKKINSKIPLNTKVIFGMIKEFIGNELSEKDFIDRLQKELGLEKEISKKIFSEIKNNIIPIINSTNMENLDNNINDKEKISISQKIKKPIGVENALLKSRKNISRNLISKEIEENILLPIEEKSKTKSTKKSNSDTYRESIE